MAGRAPAQGLGRILVLAAKRLEISGVELLALVPDKFLYVNFLLARIALFPTVHTTSDQGIPAQVSFRITG